MIASEDSNVYYKSVSPSGKVKYVPFGNCIGQEYLGDGIWYVHHDNHSCGTTNVDRYLVKAMKMGDSSFPDIPEVCGSFDCFNYIWNHPDFQKFHKGNWTWTELGLKIIDLTIKYSKERNHEKEKNK